MSPESLPSALFLDLFYSLKRLKVYPIFHAYRSIIIHTVLFLHKYLKTTWKREDWGCKKAQWASPLSYFCPRGSLTWISPQTVLSHTDMIPEMLLNQQDSTQPRGGQGARGPCCAQTIYQSFTDIATQVCTAWDFTLPVYNLPIEKQLFPRTLAQVQRLIGA